MPGPRAGKSKNGFFYCDTWLQIFQNDSKICEGEVRVTPLINKICKLCTGFPLKWHLRNECRNSMLITRHYPDLGSAYDWLKQHFLAGNLLEALPRTGSWSTSSVWNFYPHSSHMILQENHCKTKITAWENSWHLAIWQCCHWFPCKWHLRNEHRNSILMTRHNPVLGSASGWLNQISHAVRLIRSTTQTSEVTHH